MAFDPHLLVFSACSIVLFGGDGIYHETVNGLQRRLATEAGIDVNNPGTSLPAITIPIGMIPTGMPLNAFQRL